MFSTERQKATRIHKRLKKRLDAYASSPNNTSEHAQLEKSVHDAEIDLNYTIYHPLTEKYQSIFPRQEHADGGGETPARKLVVEKPAMWHVVERCAAEGTLEALRDGKVATGISVGKGTPAMVKAGKRGGRDGLVGSESAKSAKSAKPREQEGDSDGGFFEE